MCFSVVFVVYGTVASGVNARNARTALHFFPSQESLVLADALAEL